MPLHRAADSQQQPSRLHAVTRTQSNLLVILLALAVALLGFIAWGGTASPPTAEGELANGKATTSDPREVVSLNDEQLQFALGQMRGFLQAFEDLDAAELENDLEAMAGIAAAQGPGPERAHPEGFRDQLPESFRGMSRNMRQAFLAMEKDLKRRDLNAYRATRIEVLRTCNTCHAAYRFDHLDSE